MAAQRAEPDPRLVRVPRPSERQASPQNRYAMAGGCYALRGPDGWVVRDGVDATRRRDVQQAASERFHFQATTLGRYLLWDSSGEFLSSDDLPVGPGVAPKADADGSSIWTVTKPGGFVIAQGQDRLTAGDPLTTGAGSQFRLRLTYGCEAWPEIGTQISGRPFAGASPFQEVRGTTDNHTHGMAFRFLVRRGALRQALVAVRRDAGAAGLPRPPRHQRRAARSRPHCPASRGTTRSAGRPSWTGRPRRR